MEQDTPVEQVVLIGTSKGGLAALRQVLRQLPSDLDAAVFITMHIGNHVSSLPDSLAAYTHLPVSFAETDQPIKKNQVYVAPPDHHLLLQPGTMQLVRSAKENHTRPAIDPMFRSAAISYGQGAAGVILTGELDDGVVGLQAIKAYGGLAFVQEPKTAEASSMPGSALRYVEVDFCLPLGELGKAVAQALRDRRAGYSALHKSSRTEPFVTENKLTYDLSAGGANALDGIGKVSGMTCPECGGALFELGSSPLRFRCHTGHAYTSASLLGAQDESIEEALWVAIRALHEKQLLLESLARSSEAAGRSQAVEEYELAIRGIEQHKAALQALITEANRSGNKLVSG